MAYALSQDAWGVSPGTLSNLIAVDIAPSIGSLSPEFIRYIGAMQKIEALPPGVINTRADADLKLQPYESVSYHPMLPFLRLTSLPIYNRICQSASSF